MLITIYNNKTFERKETISRYNSVIYNRNLYDIGSFQFSLKKSSAEVGDLVLYEDFCGKIKRIVENFSGVTIYGYDLKSLFYQRVFDTEVSYVQQTPEFILKDIAKSFLATEDRAISGLRVAEDSGEGELIDYTFSQNKRVSEELKSFCRANSIGYDIYFDEKELVFDVIKERDNTEIVFSKEKRNAGDIEYRRGDYDFANCYYYKNEDESVLFEGTDVGIDRFEGFAEASGLAEYKQEHAFEETLRATDVQKLAYGNDYMLGDIVTVKMGDLTATKTITEIQYAFEYAKKVITPVFGTEKENPIKRIMRGE